MEQFATLIVGALASGIATYVLTRLKIQKDLEAKYDADLRRARLQSYGELWHLLQPLALFGRNGFPTRQTLDHLTGALTEWYFSNGGGIYLSVPTRDAYFRLQRALRDILAWPSFSEPTDELDQKMFEHLRSIGSRLRARMTMDVGTRKSPMFDASADEGEISSAPRDDRKDADEDWILHHVSPRHAQPEPVGPSQPEGSTPI